DPPRVALAAMSRSALRTALLSGCVGLLLAISGCGAGTGTTGGTATQPRSRERPSPREHRDKPAVVERVAASHCPPGLPGCRTTKGRIVYVERVDPDGDGDAHFVVIDPQGITLPGLTSIDVRRGLRPQPLPGP